ncbi:MAG: Kdo(2)-lipid A phosphoethanolamine 7''-transferase [Candidatus Erwinia impunctatus]|nr:Kdo(2)-lipid A phosphoethanolamine 7''-transferase [Culicoides impunctatus]
MNVIKRLTQSQLSLFLAIYIGIFLNSAVFYHRFTPYLHHAALMQCLSALAEMVAVVMLTFFLLRLLSLTGKVVWRVAASLLLVISVTASYCITFFNVVIGYGIIASVMTTDIDLSKEVVGYHLFIWVGVLSVLPLWLIWKSPLLLSLPEQMIMPGKRLRPLLVLLFAVAVVWLPLKYFDHRQTLAERQTNIDLPSYGGVVAHSYLPSNWLSALGLYIYTSVDEQIDSDTLFNPAAQFSYQAPAGIDDTYVVFVIGETTRWDHMGLLGYERDTTPKLAQEPNLVAFRGISCDTATKLSLRCMFVREGGTVDDPAQTLKEQNVFAVLKQLGFSSDLFAMQSEVWFYNNTDADNYAFREQIGSEEKNRGKAVDDMLLIPELQQSLKNHPRGKHLVILHTKGSHYLYSQRYPREYARFQPECMGVDESCSKAMLINAFDNSVLYVDTMLDSVLDQLRDKKAIVFYAADHGESTSDNTHFHGTPRQLAPVEQFRVPLLVWMSDSYLAEPANRQAFLRLKQQQQDGKVHRHVELFDSLLGCLGYTSSDVGINPANNWCAAPASAGAVQ